MIFDVNEANDPLKPKFCAPYWLSSSVRHTTKNVQDSHASIRNTMGIEPEDQVLLFPHKKYAAAKLFSAILTQKIQESGKIQCLVTEDTDPFVLEAIDEMSAKGCMKIFLPTLENGQIDLEKTKELITYKSAFLSCSYVHRKTGVLEDVLALRDLCQKHDMLYHLDFDQSIAPYFLGFSETGCDFLTMDCTFTGAPLGTSLLAIKKDTLSQMPFDPLLAEVLFNTANALDSYRIYMQENSHEIARQRNFFEARVQEELKAKILCKTKNRRINCSLLQVPQINHETLAFFLRDKNILAGLNKNLDCLQIHFPCGTTYEEIQALTKNLIMCTKKLQDIGGVENAVQAL